MSTARGPREERHIGEGGPALLPADAEVLNAGLRPHRVRNVQGAAELDALPRGAAGHAVGRARDRGDLFDRHAKPQVADTRVRQQLKLAVLVLGPFRPTTELESAKVAHRMIRAASLDEYTMRPAGTFWSGEHFLALCESEALYAVYLWGRPGGAEAQQLIRALEAEVRHDAQPHRSFIDFSALTGIDSEAFTVLRAFLARVEERQKQVTLQEALIRPSGLAGTVVAGYYVIYPPPYPVKVFADSLAAGEWLAVDHDRIAGWKKLSNEIRAVSPELIALRSVLESQIAQVDLLGAAAALGVSSRTLQRRLKHHGTTFQHQLDAVRRSLAEGLVADSDEKLAAIAGRLGFASHQHFSEWFHRQTGVTAESWRLRARRSHHSRPQ